jgi:glutamate carboxypeptidase
LTYISLTKAEHSVVDAISATKHEMLSIVKDWSSINSGSYNHSGLKDMRERLSDSFSSLPGEISELTLEEGLQIDQKGNIETVNYESALKISVRPKAPIQLVLTGHYDTVFPVDSHFQNYETIGDGILKGPGVADMKGGIVVMKTALQFFETMPISKNIGYNILLSPDEEIGSLGSASILEDLGRASHAGLTYEPSLPDGSLAGARKGSGNFTVIIKGRAAHAGREHHLGRNAIVAMAEFINGLEKLNGKREGLTINIAKIEGGGPSNIVPDLSIGHFNIRMQEEEDMQWVSNKINILVAHINDKKGIFAHLHGGFTRPPKPMSPANASVFAWVKKAGNLLGQEINWSPSGGVCEGNNLWASGCPNVDTLGVIGGEIHSDREYMRINSLTERARLSCLILLKIASGEFDAIKAKKLVKKC